MRACHLGFCLLLAAGMARAEDSPFERVSISSSPNPVGSGARAAGMGNAFVAVADDATAASWNPAGLIQLLRPEVSVVGVYVAQVEKRRAGTDPAFGGEDAWGEASLNFASFVLPVALKDRNLVFSISRQELFRFDREMAFTLNKHVESGLSGPIIRQSIDVRHDQDFVQEGSLSAVAFSGALELTPRLAFGASLNVWNDDLVGDNAWTKRERAASAARIRTETISGDFTSELTNVLDVTDTRTLERGLSVNLGLLWHPNERWTFALAGKTPFTADLSRRTSTASYDPNAGGEPAYVSSRMTEEMDFPGSIAAGVSWRRDDFFTVSADVTRVDWGNFRLHTGGASLSPITGGAADDADIPVTWAVRIGAEWLRPVGGTIVPLRVGAFYDPEPADGARRDAWGVSCGAGMLLSDRASIDIAYTYRWAEDAPLAGVDGADLESHSHQVMFSTIFYF